MATFTYRGASEKTKLDRVLLAFAKTRLGGLLFITVFPAIDRRLMPLTRGRVYIGIRQTILLLHVRGAKSGQMRMTPLLFTPRDEQMVVVASKAGADHHPAWYHNVKANSDVEVELRGRRLPMRARELIGAEREDAWALVNDNYSGYETYQGRAGDRVIGVIALEPR